MPTREDISDRLVDLLPILVTGCRLSRQPFCIIHTAYSYTRDYLSALAGIGLTLPIMTVLSQSPNRHIWAGLEGLPVSVRYFAIGSVLLATLLKIYIHRANVERRAFLAKHCEQEMRGFFSDVEEALHKEDPIPDLLLVRNTASGLKRKNVQENSWTYKGGIAPGAEVEADATAKRLCDRNERWWKKDD